MRAMFWLWAVFLLVCLVTDSAAFWVLRERMGQSLELALDAAIVGSVAEEDLMRGRLLAQRERAAAWAWDVFRGNMAGPLEGGLSFHFQMGGDRDQIWVEGQAKAEAPFLLGALTGRGRREIVVNRKMNYQGNYK